MNKLKLFISFFYTSIAVLFLTAIIIISGCASEPISAPTELTECQMIGYSAVATELWDGTETEIPKRCQ